MRVHIFHDHPDWAQALHSSGLKQFAPKEFEVTTGLLGEPYPECDAVYCINFASARKFGSAISSTCLASHAWMRDRYDENDWSTRGVNPRRNSKVALGIIGKPDRIVCRNLELERWASQFHRNAKYIPAGVNTDIFNPHGRRPNFSKRLRIGWSGQVNKEISGRFKGYDEVWRPLVEKLAEEHDFVENTRIADQSLSWEEMADWYRGLDVFLCTATAEGTPNGPFCAAACGAVVLSTLVGQVACWEDFLYSRLYAARYSNQEGANHVVERFSELIEMLKSNDLRSGYSALLCNSIHDKYSYKVIAPRTLEFICGNY